MKALTTILVAFVGYAPLLCSGFSLQTPITSTTRTVSQNNKNNNKANHEVPSPYLVNGALPRKEQVSLIPHGSDTALKMTSSPLFSSVSVVKTAVTSSVIRKAFYTVVAALAVAFRNRILWPGATADKSVKEPLPPGTYGCPFMGHNVVAGSPSYGYGVFFTKLFKKMGRPKLFKFYGIGKPFISVSGKDTIKSVLKNEFREEGGRVSTFDMGDYPNAVELFGASSILYENDRDKHAQLRRLVGVAMTPKALADAVPAIQEAALDLVNDKVLGRSAAAKKEKDDDDSVVMWDVNNQFTLDIAWKQILGLDLRGEDQIAEFRKNVETWINSVMSWQMYIPFRLPWLHRTSAYKAKQYIVNLVEQKLAKLDRDGPDGSALSNIYFATDEDGVTRLPKQAVMDNALILILAGSETSSSTLTNAMPFLGLHKHVFVKLQEEQREMIAKHNGTTELTKQMLDEECPYLDAVIKETMRIKPIPAMEMRQTESTMVVNGQQIPKKWSLWINVRATHDQDPVCRVNDTDDHMDIGKGFQPQRWLSAETRPVDYMPWGEGGRRCLGERLATTEMKVFLATLARKVQDFDLVGINGTDEIKWKIFSAIPYPQDGVRIRPLMAGAMNGVAHPIASDHPNSAILA